MKFISIAIFTLFPLAATAQGAPGLHFIENWDQDGDNIVTLAELRQKRDDVFYMFDSDENSFLDAQEYSFFDEARAVDMEGQGEHAEGKMGRVQEGMVLTFNDTNNDGLVSQSEFLAKAADWLALIDRDGSGDVTTADFGPRG